MREATRKLINELFSRMNKADLVEVTNLAAGYHKKLIRNEADRWVEGQTVQARIGGELIKCRLETVNKKTCTVVSNDSGKKYRVPPSMIYQVK